jgi:hypothetical protein
MANRMTIVSQWPLGCANYGTDREARVAATLIVSNGKAVIDVAASNPVRARVSIAHEIGHFLIHSRGHKLDDVTLRTNSTHEEEIMSEYIGRMLLLPHDPFQSTFVDAKCLSMACINAASVYAVSIHTATGRLGDPDQMNRRMRGAIFWRLLPTVPEVASAQKRLSPFWHLCPGAFIPIRRCHARSDSVIGTIADGETDAYATAEEEVQIGALTGRYLVDAFAWGSVRSGSRSVLSLFFLPLKYELTPMPPRSPKS